MKNKLVNFIFIIIFYIIMFILSILGMIALACIDYFKWVDIILFVISATIFIIGVFQLVTNKLKIKSIGGRVWGGVFITSLIFILPLDAANKFNKFVTVRCFNNKEMVAKMKYELFEAKNKEQMFEIVKQSMLNTTQQSIENYNKVNYENINIYYGDEDCSETIKQIRRVLDVEYKPLLTYFKEFQDEEVNVIIVDKINEIDSFARENIGAYYNPITDIITTLPIKDFASIEQFKSVIFHEYTHYALQKELNATLGRNIEIPKWFNEGLATYFEEKYYFIVNEDIDTSKHIGDITKDSNFKGLKAFDYYQSSKYMVKYMIEKGGSEFISNLITDMVNTKDIYDSIENILGESFSEIEKKVLVN